jgi:hypothetical protein
VLQFGETAIHLQGIEINVSMLLYVFGMVSLGVQRHDWRLGFEQQIFAACWAP